MPRLSVIIPTHKRPQILKECLRHLKVQSIRDELEIIVVHDGEDDEETRSIISSDIIYFSIPKSQQGVARNRGVEVATAPIVLFGQDDIFFAPTACEKHLKAHDANLTAVLGLTEWDPAVGITDVMRWLDRTGWQFGYVKLKKFRNRCILKNIQHRFTYTSNLSVPLEVAKRVPFLEEVSLYGWEDIEWGLRLRHCGIPLYYEPNARALHHHKITLEDSLKRMETLGRSLPQITDINPSLDRMPTGWKLLVYKIFALLPTLRGKHYQAFLRGLHS